MTTYSSFAVYAGTFDPPTFGHLDIIERSVRIFDRVVVAVAKSPSKTSILFPPETRREMLLDSTKHINGNFEIVVFDGLLVEFLSKLGAKVVVRGLRAISDYEYEAQMAFLNRKLSAELETVFLMTSEQLSFISSSIVKEVAKYHGDVSSLVPDNVVRALELYYRGSGQNS